LSKPQCKGSQFLDLCDVKGDVLVRSALDNAEVDGLVSGWGDGYEIRDTVNSGFVEAGPEDGNATSICCSDRWLCQEDSKDMFQCTFITVGKDHDCRQLSLMHRVSEEAIKVSLATMVDLRLLIHGALCYLAVSANYVSTTTAGSTRRAMIQFSML
jgi:hypothetical protein